MARQVLPIVGAVVGAYFGNPQLGYAIGAMVGNYVDPQRIKGPRLREGPAQSYGEGSYRQVVYGTSWIWDCQVLEVGPIRKVTVEEQQGKGGGPITETERGYQTYAIGLGEPLQALRVLRKDGKIVYDVRPGSTMLTESAAFAERFRFYTGAEDQLPDPDLEALPGNGVGNTAYYRGTAYLVFPNDDVTDLAGRIPTYEAEGVQVGTPSEIVGGWFVGPVAEDGASGGSQAFYRRADTLEGLLTAPNLPLPVGVTLSRISVANGAIFLHGGTAHVSFDRGATWNATNTSLVASKNVYWNGNFYYNGLQRSADGITWGSIPGLPAGVDVVVAHEFFNNPVIGIDNAGVFHVSLDDGGNWDARPTPFSWSISATEPGHLRWMTSLDGSRGRWTDDLFQTFVSNETGGQIQAYFYSNDIDNTWIRKVSSDTFQRSTDNGETFIEVLDGVPFGSNSLNNVGWGEYIWGLLRVNTGTTPHSNYLNISNDGGEEWEEQATPIYGDGVSLVYAGSPSNGTVDASATTLEAVVEDICDRCGIDSAKLDLAELTDEVAGLTLGGPYDGAGAITTLMPAYNFDLLEADRQVHAPKRGAAVVTTITADDLIEEPDENALRGQDIEYPRSLLLKYLDPDQNYAAPAATVQRNSPDIRVRGEATAEMPIAMSRTNAYRVADRMLKIMWEDLNGEVVFSLPAGPFAWLTPTDCLGISLRGALYRVRVDKVEESAGVLKVTARRDRQSAYTSVLTPLPLPPPTPPPPTLAGVTQFVVLNIPGITDGDDALGVGIRVGVCGLPDTAWTGCRVDYSTDGGTNWIVLATLTRSARIGTLLAPITAASPHYTDRTNVLSLLMVGDDDLESLTNAQFLSEGNGAALSNADGSAELIQFRDTVDDGDQQWTASRLLRGRLATDASAHLAGTRFVMLEDTAFLPLPTALMGSAIRLRFTSLGTSPETAPVYDFTWNPVHSQREFPPAHLFLARAGDTINASTVPRHRFGTDDNPIASANWTGYRWTATDGSNTATQDTGTTTPAAAFDVTGWATPVTVTVAMTNRFTGAGPALSEQIA